MTSHPSRGSLSEMLKRKNRNWLLGLLLLVQAVCATFFLWDLMTTILGLRTTPISWQLREFLEIAASAGLVLGAVFGFRVVSQARKQVRRAEQALKTASGAFAEVIDTQFDNWALTNAERDVAWFLLKGFSHGEISTLRGTSEGTIKAQTNAIYSKAGVSGKAQLLAVFVEDLLSASSDGEEVPAT